MPKIEPFETHLEQYEEWFVQNKFAYQSELSAVQMLLPKTGEGIEIGVGSGLFAEPLGIKNGVEPSAQMRALAAKRGVSVKEGVAENLPYPDHSFGFALMVTTICFLDNVDKAFSEALRILKPGGRFIIGFIDKESPLGKLYQKYQQENVFYRLATFYSVDEVVQHLNKAGFKNFRFTQTIFQPLDQIKQVEPVKEGYGEGSFVVVAGEK